MPRFIYFKFNKFKLRFSVIVIHIILICGMMLLFYNSLEAAGKCGCPCRREDCWCPKDCTCGGAGCPPCKYFCYENPPNCLRTCGACGGECPGGGTCKWCAGGGAPQCGGSGWILFCDCGGAFCACPPERGCLLTPPPDEWAPCNYIYYTNLIICAWCNICAECNCPPRPKCINYDPNLSLCE